MISTSSHRSRPIRILVAEDNEEDVFVIREAFQDAHVVCHLDVVRDGAQAVEFLSPSGITPTAAQRPDIVLMDINMPVKNGLEALQEIRALRSTASIPVIIFTTSRSPDDIDLAYRLGASSYIVKPSGFESLQAIARSICEYWGRIVELP